MNRQRTNMFLLLLSIGLIVLTFGHADGLKSIRPAYYDIFTSEQSDFIKNPQNYVIEGCE